MHQKKELLGLKKTLIFIYLKRFPQLSVSNNIGDFQNSQGVRKAQASCSFSKTFHY